MDRGVPKLQKCIPIILYFSQLRCLDGLLVVILAASWVTWSAGHRTSGWLSSASMGDFGYYLGGMVTEGRFWSG